MLKSLLKILKTNESGTDAWSKTTVPCGKAFLSHVRVVAFYAVPHAGSTTFVEYVKKFNKRDILGRIMDNIQPKQRDMEELSVHFDEIVNANKITIYAFCEGRPMGKLVRMCWRKWIFATKQL